MSSATLSSIQLFSQTAASLLLTALWQGALLAAFVWLALKLAPRATAAARFAIWASAFGVVILLPLLRFLPHPSAGTANAALSAVNKPWLQFDIRWSLVITALWLIASLYRSLELANHCIRLRTLWKNAVPLSAEQSARFAVPSRVEVCTTAELNRPSVIGFLSPRILIPDWLLPNLSKNEVEQIVLHESEHLRRHDDWTNLLQKIVLVLFPINPVVLWIEKRLCVEREMACDEGVVQKTQAPRAYATCLTRLAERSLERRTALGALSLGAWERRSELVTRVHRILLRRQMLSPLATRGLCSALIVGLAFGSLELSRCPQLIGFVASQPTEYQASIPSGRIASSISMSPSLQLASASYQPVVSHLSAGPRMIEANAMMPNHSDSYTPAVRKITREEASPRSQMSPRITQTKFDPARMPSPTSLRVNSDQPVTGLATRSSSLAENGAGDPGYSQQSWIVLTGWQDPGDQKSASNVKTARTNLASQPSATRLVFSVVTSGPASSTFAAVPFRNGWLVIQL